MTAAKQLVAGTVSIDMLAGPSELVILADGSAAPAVVGANLLAQAEHDPDALPVLVALDDDLVRAVERELKRQLEDLPMADIAQAALGNGYVVAADSIDAAVAVCNQLAPEHLHVILRDPEPVLQRLHHYGALFIGQDSGEVLGDYGAGPNHVLPTGGTSRSTGGLSVLELYAAENLVVDRQSGSREAADEGRSSTRTAGRARSPCPGR